MKHLVSVVFVVMMAFSASAIAEDGPGTLPDGPVEGPPGWDCTAKDGEVTCEVSDQQGPVQ